MIEKEQKIRDRSYKLWQKIHTKFRNQEKKRPSPISTFRKSINLDRKINHIYFQLKYMIRKIIYRIHLPKILEKLGFSTQRNISEP